jgi:NADH:ubiquinone oxidoreductase subunit 6 (subunit J)
MAQEEEGPRNGSRGYALWGAGSMAAALALLAVVGLASTAQFDSGEALSSGELAVVVVLVGAVAVLVIGVGTVAFGSGYAVLEANRRKLIAALLVTALLAAAIALLLAPIDAPPDGGAGATTELPPDTRGDDYFRLGDNAFGAIAAAIIAGVALLAAALVVLGAMGLARRRRRSSVDRDDDEGEAVMQALDESLDDLRRERDVRRAIIACYARMERAFERAGNARRPAEAPFEYLVRVLERITANGPAARALTELFERAKFSVEPMGEREKQEAIGALEVLRAEVSKPL